MTSLSTPRGEVVPVGPVGPGGISRLRLADITPRLLGQVRQLGELCLLTHDECLFHFPPSRLVASSASFRCPGGRCPPSGEWPAGRSRRPVAWVSLLLSHATERCPAAGRGGRSSCEEPPGQVRPPKIEREELQVYTAGQVGHLLRFAEGHRLWWPILIAVSTGLRPPPERGRGPAGGSAR